MGQNTSFQVALEEGEELIVQKMDLNQLEKQVNTKFIKFNKDQCECLNPRCNNPVQLSRLGADCLGCGSVKRVWVSW